MEELYRQNAKIVYYYIYSLCRDKELAEDLTQDTFLRAFQAIDSFDGSCKLSTWLCQIGKHLLYQTWAKQKREIPTAWDDTPANGNAGVHRDAAEEAIAKVELAEVLEELKALPSAMREVIYLRTMSDLSYREIGQMLGKSETWARVNFYRGKELLLKNRAKGSERRTHDGT